MENSGQLPIAIKVTIISAKQEIFAIELHATIYTIHNFACLVLAALRVEKLFISI